MSEFRNPMTAVLQGLPKGHVVHVEYARGMGSSHVRLESVVFWGLYADDQLAVFVLARQEAGSLDWIPELHWVMTERIVSLSHDVGIHIDTRQRKLSRDGIQPLYNDTQPGWEKINEAVKYHLDRKLFEMQLLPTQPTPPGVSQLARAVTLAPPSETIEETLNEAFPVEVESVPVFETPKE